MGIRVGYEPVAAIQKLSVLAGQAEAQEREAQRKQQLYMQAKAMENQKEMAQFEAELSMKAHQRAMEWEIQKMELNSMKDFEREQMRLDALHAREVSKEIKERDEFELIKKQIEKADYLRAEDKQEAMDRATFQYLGYNPNIIRRQGGEAEMDPIALAVQKILGGVESGIAETAGITPPKVPQGIVPEQKSIGSPPKTPEITLNELTLLRQKAEREGKLIVVSPDGERFFLPASEWKDFKAQGYKLFDIENLRKTREGEAQARGRKESERVAASYLKGVSR